MLKAFFVLEIFICLSWLFGYLEKQLDKEVKVNLKFMTSENRQQIITIRILANILRMKVNQGIKFGQLMGSNVRNIFLQKLCRK